MDRKKLILFLDAGDTLIDESTEVRDSRGIVVRANATPEAPETVRELTRRGYTLVLVADGEALSFQNTLTQNGMYESFSALICSEMIRAEKPSPRMFKAAIGAADLSDGDRKRIIMVGNNLSRDIKGANALGIASVFLDWTPRYPKIPADETEKPRYTVHSPGELIGLADALEKELEAGRPI